MFPSYWWIPDILQVTVTISLVIYIVRASYRAGYDQGKRDAFRVVNKALSEKELKIVEVEI